MSNDLTISPMTLTFAFVLVLLAMYISQRERLGLAKEIGWAVFRMVVQLVIVGYVLTFIFELDAPHNYTGYDGHYDTKCRVECKESCLWYA